MKLKEAYGHPSYNKLIKAYHNERLRNRQIIFLIQTMCKDWLADKTDCEKCQKIWEDC